MCHATIEGTQNTNVKSLTRPQPSTSADRLLTEVMLMPLCRPALQRKYQFN